MLRENWVGVGDWVGVLGCVWIVEKCGIWVLFLLGEGNVICETQIPKSELGEICS